MFNRESDGYSNMYVIWTEALTIEIIKAFLFEVLLQIF